MKKQYKSSIIKNNKITNKNNFDGVPLKGYVAFKLFLDFAPEIKKKHCGTRCLFVKQSCPPTATSIQEVAQFIY